MQVSIIHGKHNRNKAHAAVCVYISPHISQLAVFVLVSVRLLIFTPFFILWSDDEQQLVPEETGAKRGEMEPCFLKCKISQKKKQWKKSIVIKNVRYNA
jgi:hypothetical protein